MHYAAFLTWQAYKTQCATTDFVTPRPVRSYMFTAAERGQLDTSRSQLGEGGEFYEEQLFGGFFGFEPCEDEVGAIPDITGI